MVDHLLHSHKLSDGFPEKTFISLFSRFLKYCSSPLGCEQPAPACIFFGPPSSALPYFTSLGYLHRGTDFLEEISDCPLVYYSASTWQQQQSLHSSSAISSISAASSSSSAIYSLSRPRSSFPSLSTENDAVEYLAKSFRASPFYESLVQQILSDIPQGHNRNAVEEIFQNVVDSS